VAFLDKIELSNVKAFEVGWIKHIKESHPEIIAELKGKNEKISKDLDSKLTKAAQGFVQQFIAANQVTVAQ